jgi:hypothetical protein
MLPPLSLDLVRDAIKKLSGAIYRCKGFLNTIDKPEYRVLLQVVGRRGQAR